MKVDLTETVHEILTRHRAQFKFMIQMDRVKVVDLLSSLPKEKLKDYKFIIDDIKDSLKDKEEPADEV